METGQEATLERAPGTSQLLLGSRRASNGLNSLANILSCPTERCILPPRCATSGLGRQKHLRAATENGTSSPVSTCCPEMLCTFRVGADYGGQAAAICAPSSRIPWGLPPF
ncbi:hypothetical protein CISG_07672 [Coccidioides immitis RMSCC 3703]|uniref:Uncharacterized protein n=1 Tax=Coccidioides immitis RMSCC 3703 TaxID=454286 RepID=A0A0J8R3D7_COCIT|nr:hypothetical protein CISG_07672 [Coccidioides immitis RMSCC 3703]